MGSRDHDSSLSYSDKLKRDVNEIGSGSEKHKWSSWAQSPDTQTCTSATAAFAASQRAVTGRTKPTNLGF